MRTLGAILAGAVLALGLLAAPAGADEPPAPLGECGRGFGLYDGPSPGSEAERVDLVGNQDGWFCAKQITQKELKFYILLDNSVPLSSAAM